MKNCGIIALPIIWFFSLIGFSNGFLISDFVKYKRLRYLAIISCDDFFANKQIRESIRHMAVSVKVYSIEKCCDDNFKYDNAAYYLDTSCDYWSKVIHELSKKNMFMSTNHWLIKTSNYSRVLNVLTTVPLRIDSEITVAVECSRNYSELYDVYHSGYYNFGSFNSTKIGNWTGVGMRLAEQWKYLRRANMTGVVLKCIIVVTGKLKHQRFEDYIEKPELTHIDSMNRFNYALLLHVKDIFNFSFSMMRTNSWGYLHNGTFDGMVGFLQRKQADIGGSPIFFRLERAKVIDYTAQTWISRHPKQLGTFYNIYTRPLDGRVWWSAFGVCAATAVALRYLFRDSAARHVRSGVDTSWSYIVLAVLSAVCQQGLTIDHSSTAIRLTIFMVFVFALTMYQFYSASITSSLLMEPPKNIRTLEDLLHSPLKVGIEDIVYNIDYFARTTDPVALQLYKKIVTPREKNFFSVEEGLARVRQGGFAFHVDIATAYRIIRETFSEREVCELAEVQLFPPQRMVAIVQKGSPYRKLVTYGLRKIAEAGLMHRQRSVWHEEKPKCVKTPDSSIFSVSIYEFSMVLLLLLSGVVLSLIILILEVLVHGWKM